MAWSGSSASRQVCRLLRYSGLLWLTLGCHSEPGGGSDPIGRGRPLLLHGQQVGLERLQTSDVVGGRRVERIRDWRFRVHDQLYEYRTTWHAVVDSSGELRALTSERPGEIFHAEREPDGVRWTRQAGGQSSQGWLPSAESVAVLEAGHVSFLVGGSVVVLDVSIPDFRNAHSSVIGDNVVRIDVDGWQHEVVLDHVGLPVSGRLGGMQIGTELTVPAVAPDVGALLFRPTPPITDPRRVRVLELRLEGWRPGPPGGPRSSHLRIEAPLEAEIPRLPLGSPGPMGDVALPERAIVGSDRFSTVQELNEAVSDALIATPNASPSLSRVSGILANGKGDCTEYAALFVAWAQRVGLQAREVAGLLWLDGPYGPGFYPHVWVEVDVGGSVGWLAVDPSLGQAIADAAHVKLVHGRRLWRVVETLEGLNPKILTFR